MSTPLLSTKFFFPAIRQNLVPRLRLVERVNEGLKGPLILVSAPAGYGKTTLMSDWRAGPGKDIHAAWISLDADGNELFRFLHYLTAALETTQTDLVGNTRLLLQSPEPPPLETILTTIFHHRTDHK